MEISRHKEKSLQRTKFTVIRTIQSQIHKLQTRVSSNRQVQIQNDQRSITEHSEAAFALQFSSLRRGDDYPPEGQLLRDHLDSEHNDFDKSDLGILLCFLAYALFVLHNYLFPHFLYGNPQHTIPEPEVDISCFSDSVGPVV